MIFFFFESFFICLCCCSCCVAYHPLSQRSDGKLQDNYQYEDQEVSDDRCLQSLLSLLSLLRLFSCCVLNTHNDAEYNAAGTYKKHKRIYQLVDQVQNRVNCRIQVDINCRCVGRICKGQHGCDCQEGYHADLQSQNGFLITGDADQHLCQLTSLFHDHFIHNFLSFYKN